MLRRTEVRLHINGFLPGAPRTEIPLTPRSFATTPDDSAASDCLFHPPSEEDDVVARSHPTNRSQPALDSLLCCRSNRASAESSPDRRSSRSRHSHRKPPILSPGRNRDTCFQRPKSPSANQAQRSGDSLLQPDLVAKFLPLPRLQKSSHLQGFAPPTSPYCRRVVANPINSLSFHGLCSPPRSPTLRFRPRFTEEGPTSFRLLASDEQPHSELASESPPKIPSSIHLNSIPASGFGRCLRGLSEAQNHQGKPC
jgi:hypothetical protein